MEQIASYRKEFDKYKKEFGKYFQSFRRIYRRLSSADWGDFNPSNWGRLEDHLITIWKTFDEQAWQTQVLALRISPLYSANPDYQDYTDKLVKLSEDQVAQLKREEAHLIELQAQDAAHHETLEPLQEPRCRARPGRRHRRQRDRAQPADRRWGRS